MYPYLLKRKLFWRFVQFTRSRDDITRSLLVLLVCMENIFKELFLFTLSRGVPLDCGCKGRYFLQTDQTLLQLFYKDFLTNSLIRWFSRPAQNKKITTQKKNWHADVAKHEIWRIIGSSKSTREATMHRPRYFSAYIIYRCRTNLTQQDQPPAMAKKQKSDLNFSKATTLAV